MSRAFATNYVSIEDITGLRPDLKQMNEDEVENIADKVGELISEAYWDALGAVLEDRYGENPGDESEWPHVHVPTVQEIQLRPHEFYEWLSVASMWANDSECFVDETGAMRMAACGHVTLLELCDNEECMFCTINKSQNVIEIPTDNKETPNEL